MPTVFIVETHKEFLLSPISGFRLYQELLAHLRRLVFSKVNHGVFRLYREADPVLARILRNTKLAIASLGQFVEVERFGEQRIAPGMCHTLEHLPPLEQTQIGEALMHSTHSTQSVPDLLARPVATGVYFSGCRRESLCKRKSSCCSGKQGEIKPGYVVLTPRWFHVRHQECACCM